MLFYLWAIGIMVAWAIATFVFHRGGWIHVMVLAAISFVVVQIAQTRRTKAHNQPN